MSRSRRKTPIVPITNADSEKADKQSAHRRERHKVKTTLAVEADPEVLPHTREISDTWVFAKDGKQYRGPAILPAERRK